MYRPLILIPLIACFLSLQFLSAQVGEPVFEKGVIYVKLTNSSKVELPIITDRRQVVHLYSSELSALYPLFLEYDVFQVKRPFITSYSQDLKNVYEVHFGEEAGIDLFVERLELLSIVDYAEKIGRPYSLYMPDDYTNYGLWHLDVIKARDAWDISKGSEHVVIAIIDDSFLLTHPDLKDNIWINQDEIPNNGIDDDHNGYIDDYQGWDCVDNDNDPNPPANTGYHGHGTAMAGCASAATDNGIGISGMGFNTQVMPLKTKEDIIDPLSPNTSSGPASNVAVQYAIDNGADIISMSYGHTIGSPTSQLLINEAHSRGIVIIAGAGNNGMQIPFYPAALDNVISVTGTDNLDYISFFSNYHATVDLSAPAQSIYSTAHMPDLTPNYWPASGTSNSAPIVAGIAALMLSVNPCLTPDEVEAMLKATAVNIDGRNSWATGLIGAGRVDAKAAVAMTLQTATPSANFSVDDLNTCDGYVQFIYTPDSLASCPSNFVWLVDGQPYTEPDPKVYFPQSGTYPVTLIVSNHIGSNQSSQTLNITVGTGTVPMVEAGGDVNGQLKTCFGIQHQLRATSNVSGGAYRWTPSAGLSNPNIPNPTLLPATSVTYSLTVTDSLGCTATDKLAVKVEALAVDAGPDVRIQPGDLAQLMANACGNNLTYTWSPTVGLSGHTIADPIATPSVTTTYYLTITDQLNNQATDSLIVIIDPAASLENAYSPLGNIQLPYPSPAQQEMTLRADLEESGDLKIEAYDLTGRLMMRVYEGRAGKGPFTVEWRRQAQLASGMYLLVWQMNGAQHVQKVQWR